jgi:hypothetical protein
VWWCVQVCENRGFGWNLGQICCRIIIMKKDGLHKSKRQFCGQILMGNKNMAIIPTSRVSFAIFLEHEGAPRVVKWPQRLGLWGLRSLWTRNLLLEGA